MPLRFNKDHYIKARIVLLFLMLGICGISISGCCCANSKVETTENLIGKTGVETTENLISEIEVEIRENFIPKAELLGYDDNIEPFSFVVISDPHSSESVRKGYEKFGTARDKFKLCLEEINKMKKNDGPEFILITGDIHLWAIKDIISDFDLPVHVVAGNHEKKEHRKELRDFFPNDFKKNGAESDYYSFLHNNVRFIGICDAAPSEHVGHLSSETIRPFGQSEWLEAELKKEEKAKVIFGHVPPEPNGEDKNMWLSRNDSLFFNDLIERTRPAMMFFGHQHIPKKLKVSGCDMYVVRSSSWNFHDLPIGFMFVSFQKKGVLIKEIIFK